MKQIWVKNLFLHVKKKLLFNVIFYYIQYFCKKNWELLLPYGKICGSNYTILCNWRRICVKTSVFFVETIKSLAKNSVKELDFLLKIYIDENFLRCFLSQNCGSNYTKLCNWRRICVKTVVFSVEPMKILPKNDFC